jgi:hypothetical protein
MEQHYTCREMTPAVAHLVDRLREEVAFAKRVAGIMALNYARTPGGAALPIWYVASPDKAMTVWADELEMLRLSREMNHLITYADGV